jgi:hypothetical protein
MREWTYRYSEENPWNKEWQAVRRGLEPTDKPAKKNKERKRFEERITNTIKRRTNGGRGH